ncbi:ribonuclease E inhibitor RraB [Caulobacter soli]|uniref:ribonuclease E inhibitor RraB n=1 Tax=Caulobacter soli TaxID=2708539 RepID=UPI00196B08F0|nr:ribonuclease E inhibitor RraB [Caulobacter soli]
MRVNRFGAAMAALVLTTGPIGAWAAPRISHAQLEEMFSNMRGSAAWNVDGPLLWGYFFTSPDRAKVDQAAKILVGRGYRLVEIHRDRGVWWLHVERVEHHTVDSLDARNAEFYAFAQGEGLATYDGMDVGPVP